MPDKESEKHNTILKAPVSFVVVVSGGVDSSFPLIECLPGYIG
jgi:NH3-dependent NAD+ synthetase